MANETFFLRMRELLGADFDDFARAMSAPPSKAICVNAKKISEGALISALPYSCRKIPYSDGGYYIDAGDEKIGSHPLFFSGAFYSQEPSAQGPVSSVTIRQNFKILDVCAAPGGKSSQAANKLSGGVLVSNEINQSRAAVLMSNIERQGFSNVIITNTDAKTLDVSYESDGQHTFVDGEDVTGILRTEEASMAASKVATYPGVRAEMVEAQQRMAKSHDMLVDGRDIGTRVLADAPVKIFLTASPEVRARRRFLQLQEKGIHEDYEKVLDDLIKRDKQDMSRETDPLKKAEDAVEVDTSEMTFQESVDEILRIIREAFSGV